MLHNLSCVASTNGLFAQALECSDLATSLTQRIPAFWSQWMYANLSLGRFDTAWDAEKYRRYFVPSVPASWDGQSQTPFLLIFNSNGMGDFIQFMRFIRLATARVSRVAVQVPVGGASLFGRSECLRGVEMVQAGDRIPHTANCELMMLPFALGASQEDIAYDAPYLTPDPVRKPIWQSLVDSYGSCPVGVVWGGGEGRSRTLPLSALTSLFSVPGTHFFGLQSGSERNDLFGRRLPDNFTDLGVFDLDTLASICACMKVVIAPDVGIAHLCAALGVETWLALPHPAEWRWGTDPHRTVWYPGMRLYRQSSSGDWGSVIDRMREDLLACLSGRTAMTEPGLNRA